MNKEEFLSNARSYIEVKGDNYAYVETLNKTMIGRANTVYSGQPARKERIAPPKALSQVVGKMIAEGMICQPQDLCMVYKLDQEIPCMGFLSAEDFYKRMPKLLPQLANSDLMPNSGHMKSLNFGSKPYPDWPWDSLPARTVPHYKAVCNMFLDSMAALGFTHPNNA